jgi:transposase
LKEAAPKVLSLSNKKPMVAREIWEALKAEGYQTAASDPVHAVHDALRRREKTHGDVLLIGQGRWGRPEWYTEEQIKEIDKSMGGMGGRDRGSHIERTKRGMTVAKSRGARIGAVSKLSEEQWADAERMLKEGKSPQQVADTFKVVRQTIYNRFGRDRIRELRGLPKRERLDDEDGAGETRH